MTGNSAQQRKKIRQLLWRWGKVTAFCARRMRVISEYQALMEQAAGLHSSSLNSLPGTKRSGDATGQAAIRLDQLRELFAQRIAEANEDIARELAFAAALDGVIQELPGTAQMILELRYRQEYSYQRIAREVHYSDAQAENIERAAVDQIGKRITIQ